MTVYEIVTNRIIKELKNGRIPWRKPWMSMGLQTGAYNRITKKPYSLLNQIILRNEGEYATFQQWSSLGGHIKSGSESEMIVFWKISEYEKENTDGIKELKQIPILRYYRVFHISQVEGVEPLPKREPDHHTRGIQVGDLLIKKYCEREEMKIRMDNFSEQAFYSPIHDYVQVPCKEQYQNISEFYSTVFHELVHSTGHEKRLDRGIMENARFGSCDYSKEELVAEIASAMIMNIVGIETTGTFHNSSAYIQSWLHKLQDDNKFIIYAAGKAEKAVKYILGKS